MPFDRDPPGKLLTLLVGAVLGLAIGAGTVLAKENVNPTIRTPRQLEDALGVECFGVLPSNATLTIPVQIPDVASAEKAPTNDAKSTARQSVTAKPVSSPASPTTATDAAKPQAVSSPAKSSPDRMNGQLRRAIDNMSTTLALERRDRAIGITSVGRGDGKTFIAWHLANFIASSGQKVLLIDAAGGPKGLSGRITTTPRRGLPELIQGKASFDDVVLKGPELDFITVGSSSVPDGLVMGSKIVGKIISDATKHYDVVILDLPALSMGAVARAAAHHLDSLVLVARWAETREDELSATVSGQDVVRTKLAGTVLNRTDMKTFATFPDAKLWLANSSIRAA